MHFEVLMVCDGIFECKIGFLWVTLEYEIVGFEYFFGGFFNVLL